MFPDELLVFLEAIDPSAPDRTIHVQLLVDSKQVEDLDGTPARGKPVPAWLRVALANTSHGLATIVLPQPAMPVGETAVVRESTLRRRAG